MPQMFAAIAAFSATTVGAVVLSTLGRLALSVALSALLAPDVPKSVDPGIRTTFSQTGDVNFASFIMGTSATGGTHVCPPMSHGYDGETPNAYLTYVIALADTVCPDLTAIIIDGQYANIGAASHPTYGQKLTGRFLDKAWLIYHDGTQTTADSMLVEKYGSYPRRPWQADMIGRGMPYVILTFLYDRKLFPGLPKMRAVTTGGRYYDPRKDTTVGGSGAHRFEDQTTWQVTRNPIVQVYNIMRGIRFNEGTRWGGKATLAELPLSNWFAEMNKCDVDVDIAGGGTQPRYRTGSEFTVNDEPSACIDAILRGCDGNLVDMGGYWRVRVGGPGLPVMFITDADIVVSQPQNLDPFPSIDGVFNGVNSSYPSPGNLWEPKDAPALTNAIYQAEDQGEQRMAELNLPTVSDKQQVQRLMKAFLNRQRKFIAHRFTLSPAAAILEPLDCISWTSVRNGYVDKRFDVEQIATDLKRLNQAIGIRETNPNDYDWAAAEEQPEEDVPNEVVVPPAQVLTGVTLTGVVLNDGQGFARRPALVGGWIGARINDASAIRYELRVFGTSLVIGSGSLADVEGETWTLPDTLIPATTYEWRVRLVVRRRETDWSAWVSATTPAVYYDDRDTTIPDIEGNLIFNGRFKYGDLRFWENIAPGYAVIPKAGGGNAQITACATANMLQLPYSATSRDIYSNKFDIDTDDLIRVVYFTAGSNFSAGVKYVSVVVGLQLFRADGSAIGFVISGGSNPTGIWTRRFVDYASFNPEAVQARLLIQYTSVSPSGPNPDAYLTRIRVFNRRDAEDRAADNTVSTRLMKLNTTHRLMRDSTIPAINLTTASQIVAATTNTDDQDATEAPTLVIFTAQIIYEPPAADTTIIVSILITGPNGFSQQWDQTVRNNGGGASPFVRSIVSVMAVIPAGNGLPDNYYARALVDNGAGKVSLVRRRLVTVSMKRTS